MLLLFLGLPAVVSAQNEESSSGCVREEQRVQIRANPGETVEGELFFTSEGPDLTTAHLSVVGCRIMSDGAQLQPLSELPNESPARWVSLASTSLMLQPASPEPLRYRVQVPPDASPGDHSALILLETEEPSSRVGARLTLSLPGQAQQGIELRRFEVQPVPLTLLTLRLPFRLPIYDSGPVIFRTLVHNGGDVREVVEGQIQVLDLLGNRVASLDLRSEPMFPGDDNWIVIPWSNPPGFGFFTARINVETEGAPMLAEARVLVLPWQQLLAALLLVVALRLLLGRSFALPLPTRRPAASAAGSSDRPADVQTSPDVTRGSSMPAISDTVASGPPESGDRVADLAVTWTSKGERGVERASAPETATPAVDQTAASVTSAHEPGGAAGAAVDPQELLEMLQLGKSAARNGDRLAAYGFFRRVLELDPDNEEAWLWRGGTAENPQEMRTCLERVLEINPGNVRARRGLEDIHQRFAQRGV